MAQHGSGARTPAVGYRLMSLRVHPNGTVASYSVFAEGWLTNPRKRQFWGELAFDSQQGCWTLLGP